MANAKIVIVDDDADIRDSLQVILESRQYTVLTAADRDEGMAMIKAEKPDVLILDVMMATWQDGFEMARELKQDPDLENMPIIMLTGVKGKTGIDFESSSGDPTWLPVEEFINKPVEPDALVAKIEEVLAKKG